MTLNHRFHPPLPTTNKPPSFQTEQDTDDVAGNLYAVKFFPSGPGFVLGNDAILLRYIGA